MLVAVPQPEERALFATMKKLYAEAEAKGLAGGPTAPTYNGELAPADNVAEDLAKVGIKAMPSSDAKMRFAQARAATPTPSKGPIFDVLKKIKKTVIFTTR